MLSASATGAVLPNGWIVRPAPGLAAQIGTMPQGAAVSPDGTMLAIVESGFNPAALRLLNASTLREIASIKLAGAFGRPAWRDARHVLVAGANADVVYDVDVLSRLAEPYALPKKSYPVALALSPDRSRDRRRDRRRRCGARRLAPRPGESATVSGGQAPRRRRARCGSANGLRLRAVRELRRAIDLGTRRARDIAVKLHPSDLLFTGGKLYVAETDADEIGVVDPATMKRTGGVFVGERVRGANAVGVSVNALAAQGNVCSRASARRTRRRRTRRPRRRPDRRRLVSDRRRAVRLAPVRRRRQGRANAPEPGLRRQVEELSRLRRGDRVRLDAHVRPRRRARDGQPARRARLERRRPARTVLRKDGPIRHVFFVLKENRSYDQVLGDVRGGNGDPSWSGSTAASRRTSTR